MEAKVDIRKLQLLNDRINQTIDALNQVRLSVHGLAQTAGMPGQFAQIPGVGFGPQAFGPQMFGPQTFGQQGFGQQGFGQQGFVPQGMGQMGQLGQGVGWGGMSHTGGMGFGAMSGVGQQPWGMGGVQQALAQNPYLAQVLAMNPYLQTGISHTSPEAQAQWLYQQQQQIDPYYGMRVSQTFPFAQLPLSPMG